MRIGVLGTGMAGHALATRLVEVGHELMMGSRAAGNEKAVAWAASMGPTASEGSFEDAAAFGEMLVNATGGAVSMQALTAAGAGNLSGKVLLDVSNPIAPAEGGQLTLTVCNTDSMGEQIQRAFPDALVVKALNMVNADVMVHPDTVPDSHNLFLCGNDDGAKAVVTGLLESFGWPADALIDIGDITGARAMEMYLPLWIRMARTLGSWHVNVKVVVGPPA